MNLKNLLFSSVILTGFMSKSPVYAGSGPITKPLVTNKTYFIGIGCSAARIHKYMADTIGLAAPIINTSTDLRNWEQALFSQAQFLRNRVIILENPSATEIIADSLQTLIHRMEPGDNLIFYFSGSSLTFRDTIKGENETRFYLQQKSSNHTSAYFTMDWLRNMLDLIPARNQAVILDAGKSQDLRDEIIEKLTESNVLKAKLENRERIIICNHGEGWETRDGGVLTNSIIKTARSYRRGNFSFSTDSQNVKMGIRFFCHDLFSQGPNGKFLIPWKIQSFLDSVGGGMKLNYIRESDITDVLARYKAKQQKQSLTRSDNIQLKTEGSLKVMRDTGVIRKYALIVGNNDYQFMTPLNNPVDDAVRLADILKQRYGYQVFLMLNSTTDQFWQTMNYLRDSIVFGPHDQLVVYIAGHGNFSPYMRAGGIAFTNTRPLAANPNMDGYILHGNLINMLQNLEVNNMLVILDVCFGGTLAYGSQSEQSLTACGDDAKLAALKRKLGGMAKEEIAGSLNCSNKVFITSGGKEYVPDGTPGAHSPFTAGLIEQLESAAEGPILATELVTSIRRSLKNFDRSHQSSTPVPVFGRFGVSSLQSDFVIYK